MKWLELESTAMQLKINEIVRSTQGAHNAMLGLGNLSTGDLNNLQAVYKS